MKLSTKIIFKFFPLKERFWQYKIKSIPDGIYLSSQDIKLIKLPETAEEFGAPDETTYQIWKKQVCGIITLKMLTDHFDQTKNFSIYQLLQKSLDYHVFIVPKKIEQPTDIKGAFHQALLNFARSFGLKGFMDPVMPLEKIIWYLYRGWFVLASINHHQLWQDDQGDGRHMVLVTGFEKRNKQITKIYYKDSSTSQMWNQETDEVDFEQFKQTFNKRGIFLTNSKSQAPISK
jgi:hypothetical protein